MAGRLLGDIASPEIPKALRESSILCLPMGATEQHGPHLPLNTDTVLAEEYVRRIVARWGSTYDLRPLAAIPVGLSREHEWAPGTLSLSVEGMTALIRSLGRTVSHSPTRNLAIINGHGGNRGILAALIQDLRADFGLNVCVMHPTGWPRSDSATDLPDIHAGHDETSMMLAAAPHLVRKDQIASIKPSSNDAVRATILESGVSWPWTTDEKKIADQGVIGDPKNASADIGERMLKDIAEKAGGILKQLLDRQDLARRC